MFIQAPSSNISPSSIRVPEDDETFDKSLQVKYTYVVGDLCVAGKEYAHIWYRLYMGIYNENLMCFWNFFSWQVEKACKIAFTTVLNMQEDTTKQSLWVYAMKVFIPQIEYLS